MWTSVSPWLAASRGWGSVLSWVGSCAAESAGSRSVPVTGQRVWLIRSKIVWITCAARPAASKSLACGAGQGLGRPHKT